MEHTRNSKISTRERLRLMDGGKAEKRGTSMTPLARPDLLPPWLRSLVNYNLGSLLESSLPMCMGPRKDLGKRWGRGWRGSQWHTADMLNAEQMEPIPPSPPMQNGNELSTDGIASLLAMARQRINEGNPSLSLQAVVIALRATGGERAVLQALGRAREMYETKRRSNEAVDELSALLAECGLATDVAARTTANPRSEIPAAAPAVLSGVQEVDMTEHSPGMYQSSAPILAESGRLQVVMDASSDGSSFVCVQCGGVVSNQRRDEHFTFWCSRESR